MTTIFETEPCSRCGGTGQYSFNGEHSRCYKCDGKNGARALTKRGVAAKEYYIAKLMIAAKDVKIGDIICDLQAGVKQLTVATIETKKSGVRFLVAGAWKDGSDYLCFTNEKGAKLNRHPDEMVRRLPTPEENETLKADALAYQATLTKAGTPRK